jgi:hypothetical protein
VKIQNFGKVLKKEILKIRGRGKGILKKMCFKEA